MTELEEIGDYMTEEYIEEQNEIEENDGDADWDVENPYLDDFEEDSDIIALLHIRYVENN